MSSLNLEGILEDSRWVPWPGYHFGWDECCRHQNLFLAEQILWTTKSQWNDIKWLQIAILSTDSERAHRDASNEKSTIKNGADMDENWGNQWHKNVTFRSFGGVFQSFSNLRVKSSRPTVQCNFSKATREISRSGGDFFVGGGSRF